MASCYVYLHYLQLFAFFKMSIPIQTSGWVTLLQWRDHGQLSALRAAGEYFQYPQLPERPLKLKGMLFTLYATSQENPGAQSTKMRAVRIYLGSDLLCDTVVFWPLPALVSCTVTVTKTKDDIMQAC